MRTKLFFCALLLGACTLSAQNITLSPEAGVSVVRRPPYGEDWRPAAKVGVAVDFNLTKHFGIESGLFYTFRHYKIDDGGIYSNDDATWMETVSRTPISSSFPSSPSSTGKSIRTPKCFSA